MFKQENRLKSEKDIKLTLNKGKSVFDAACGVKVRENKLKDSRFAVVIGTKVHKSAVKRNRVRRQYREIVKNHLEEIKMGYDIVLLTGKDSLDLDFAEKEARLMKVLAKSGLLL
jgi:ribonuclease P protein component